MSDVEFHAVVMQMWNDIMDDDSMLEIITLIILICSVCGRKRKRLEYEQRYSILDRIPSQVKQLSRLIGVTDADCIANLRMDRNTFGRLVLMLRQLGGLVDGKYVSVEEHVATFVGILAHHKKNRVVGFDYWRSGQTVSKYFRAILKSVLKLHDILLVRPEPVSDDSTDPRWKWFKGCLGALDGTYISVRVPSADKPRYMNRKGEISTNTLAVCDRNLRFVYVLPGWEGSAADSRVLRDAINKPNGFKVPRGCYYLADSGYTNSVIPETTKSVILSHKNQTWEMEYVKSGRFRRFCSRDWKVFVADNELEVDDSVKFEFIGTNGPITMFKCLIVRDAMAPAPPELVTSMGG